MKRNDIYDSMTQCRILGNNHFGDRSIIWSGYCITIDRDTEFATRKQLPKIARVFSLGGSIFDVYMGKAMSALGGMNDFAVAVEVAHAI